MQSPFIEKAGRIEPAHKHNLAWDIYDRERLVAEFVHPEFAEAMVLLGHRRGRKQMAQRLIRQEFNVGLGDSITIYNTFVNYFDNKEHELCPKQSTI